MAKDNDKKPAPPPQPSGGDRHTLSQPKPKPSIGDSLTNGKGEVSK